MILLPVNINATYDESDVDPSVQIHQRHHDLIHPVVNLFDPAGTPAVGWGWRWNAAAGAFIMRPPHVFNVRDDFGAVGNGTTDDSAAFTAAINAAAAVKGEVVVPVGTWVIDNVGVPDNVSIRGLGAGPLRFGTGGGVILLHKAGSAKPCLVLNGQANGLENLTLDGNGATGTVLIQRQGFENRLRRVRVINGSGIGLEVRGASNAQMHDVYVDNCGSASLPGVLISSSERSINTLDLYGLHVERCAGVHIQIGQDNDLHVPEFVRFVNLHVEAVTDNGGVLNNASTPLIDIRHGRSVSFINPFIYGGPGPLIRHQQGANSKVDIGVLGGITIVGGTLLGRNAAAGNRPDVLIDLVRGTEFSITGTRLDESISEAIRAGSGYGSRVFVSPDCIFTPRTGGRFNDLRITDPQPWRLEGPTTFNGRLVSNVPRTRPTLAAGAGAGTRPPAPASKAHNDTKGTLFFGTGTNPAAGAQIVVTFARAYATAPVVQITERTAGTKALGLYVVETTTGFTVHSSSAPAGRRANTTYSFHYMVIG